MESLEEARALGRVEGRAEALEQIASLHEQIASLAAQVEQLLLEHEKRTKELMTTVYKELKQEFRRQTSALTPKEVMDICKPCLRRVAEAQGPQTQNLFRNASFMTRETQPTGDEPAMPPPIDIPVVPHIEKNDKKNVVNHLVVTTSEKIGSGRSAHTVYVVEIRDGNTNAVLAKVKRRYKDFVWLWERLSNVYTFVCIPTLPPKNGIRDNSKFNPVFIEKRKRALQLWVNHLAWHYVTGYSTEMQMFLDGSDLVHVPRTPPFMFPRRRRTMSNEGSVRRTNAVEDKRLDRTLKYIQDKLPTLQRHFVKVSKQLDGILKYHVDMSSAIEQFSSATTHLGNFERLNGNPTVWECLKPFALTHIQHWHDDTYELWDSSLQEMLHFQQTQVMPRFEKQVHDLSKDMQASTVEKISLEWDELQNIQARSILDSLLHVATQMHSSHSQIQQVWQSAKAACMAIETNPPSSTYQPQHPPATAPSYFAPEPPRHEVFEHPTLDRPLKPNLFVNTLDPDVDDAKNLFGCSPANPEAVFSAYQSSDEEDAEEDGNHDPFSASWDSYIDRLRRKQKKQAKAEAAAVDEAKKKEKEAEQAAEIRKNRKRPQSMQWPLKRMTRAHQTSARNFAHDDFTPIPKSNSNPSFDTEVKSAPTPAPSTPTSDNWIEVKTDSGQTYYYHRISRATRWTKPDQAVLDTIEDRLAAQEEATQRRLEERRKWYEDSKRQQEWEASQIESFRGEVTNRVREWARNKDVVMMLRSLHDIIPSSLLKSGQRFEVDSPVNVSSVKKAYMKAVRQIHPDKLPKSDFDVKDRFLAQHLFSTLTLAHDEYQRTHTAPSS